MRVITEPSTTARVVPTLEAAVTDADYISLPLPLSDETRGIIDGRIIGRMKQGAVLVNTSRAACVVSGEVAAALRSGHLRCYASDVWSEEPPCADDPLYRAPNVIMTPHIGANSVENLSRIGEEVYNAVSQFLREHV